MTTTKTSSQSRTATKGRSKSASGGSSRRSGSSSRSDSSEDGSSASSKILQLVSGVMGSSLSETVNNMKSKVADQVSIHGEEYLDSAREHISEITAKVVEWGKKHPVKTVAAAAALVAVSGFLYATLNDKSGQRTKSARSGGSSR